MSQLLQATEAAAIACYEWIGRGREKDADIAATEALRKSLNALPIRARIVIGEGERDKAPMLHIGEKLGTLWGKNDREFIERIKSNDSQLVEMDVAVDPLEGTTICANNMSGALSVMAVSERGGLLNAPDVYMEKIAIGSCLPENLVDLDAAPMENIIAVAKAKKCEPCDLCIVVLNRLRNAELIKQIRTTGARVKLIGDGDISAILEVCDKRSGVDMYYGSGGAPEGVLAAAALTAMGGQMQGRLLFQDIAQIERAKEMNIFDLGKKYSASEMAPGERVKFYATGVTTGALLKGVVFFRNGKVLTNSIEINKEKRTIQYISKERF